MISLSYTPQQNSFLKAEYTIENDILTVTISDTIETFDFTGLAEGITEEIIVEILPINPIVSVEKIADTVYVTAIRLYSTDEKDLFEVVQNA